MKRRRYKRPFILYHWTPVSRRKQILKQGLRVGRKPVVHSQAFQYLCFSNSPSMAWALSAVHYPTGEWDLWMCWSDCVDGSIAKREDLNPLTTEFRFYQDIPKSKIWLVGTREYKGRRKAKKD